MTLRLEMWSPGSQSVVLWTRKGKPGARLTVGKLMLDLERKKNS